MKKAIILFIISIMVPALHAQNDTLNTPEKISEHFFMLFATDTDNAVDFLFSTNKWFNIETIHQQ